VQVWYISNLRRLRLGEEKKKTEEEEEQTTGENIMACSIPWNGHQEEKKKKLECGPMPNVMAALPNTGGALCSTPQSLADAHY